MSDGQWTKVECLCGRQAAIPEFGFWPLCGNCGLRMVAPVGDDAKERITFDGAQGMYAAEQLVRTLDRLGFPTEAQDWPRVTGLDGARYARPPWEVDRG